MYTHVFRHTNIYVHIRIHIAYIHIYTYSHISHTHTHIFTLTQTDVGLPYEVTQIQRFHKLYICELSAMSTGFKRKGPSLFSLMTQSKRVAVAGLLHNII